MNDDQLKEEIKNNPDKLYKKSEGNQELSDLLEGLSEKMKQMNQQQWRRVYSREYCLEIAKLIPASCTQELFDNADRIKKWLEGGGWV